MLLFLIIPFLGFSQITSCEESNGSVVIRSAQFGRNTIWVGSDKHLAGWSRDIIVIRTDHGLKVYDGRGATISSFDIGSGAKVTNVSGEKIYIKNSNGSTTVYDKSGRRA